MRWSVLSAKGSIRPPRKIGLSSFLSISLGLLAISAIASSQERPAALSSQLDSYLSTTVRPSTAERKLLMNGGPVSKLLDADASKEVAVFGAVWIDAPVRRYVEAVEDIENFEKGGGFILTKRISSPPALADFSQLRLPEDDVRDLKSCRVGDCQLKLGEKGLQAFRTEVNWNGPDTQAAAEAVMRRLAFEYVIGYLEGGNERLAVYRDNSPPMFVAEEFRSMVNGMPSLTTYLPSIRRYLLEYPKVQLPDATSFLYWQETEFGLKRTVRINHLTIHEGADSTVVASKMLYASHYFWTALELRVLLPDTARGPGFWLITVNRSRSDGLSGFTGLFVRRRVRSEVVNGVQAALRATKNRLERSR
jgi:hypothetical protein